MMTQQRRDLFPALFFRFWRVSVRRRARARRLTALTSKTKG